MIEDEDDIIVLFLKKHALPIDFYSEREGGVAGKAGGGRLVSDVKVKVEILVRSGKRA